MSQIKRYYYFIFLVALNLNSDAVLGIKPNRHDNQLNMRTLSNLKDKPLTVLKTIFQTRNTENFNQKKNKLNSNNF